MLRKLLYFTFALLILSSTLKAQNGKDVFEAARTGDLKTLTELYAINSDTVNSLNQNQHSPLIIAVYNQQVAASKYLIDHGANVNYEFTQGNALHGAAYKGYIDVAQLLLNYNINVNEKDANGSTPLIYATLFGHTKLAKLLIEKGATPLVKDQTGSSAYDYAQQLSNEELISLFSKHIKQ